LAVKEILFTVIQCFIKNNPLHTTKKVNCTLLQ